MCVVTEINLSKAETWNARKSTLLSRINHAIRTPVNGILGTIDTMECNECADDILTIRTQVKILSPHRAGVSRAYFCNRRLAPLKSV